MRFSDPPKHEPISRSDFLPQEIQHLIQLARVLLALEMLEHALSSGPKCAIFFGSISGGL
jgi:hypothetical protein